MLKNGDFEEGPYIFPDTPWGVLVPPIFEDAHSPLPGWTIMSDTKVVKYVDAAHHAVPQGARAVELVAGRECALVQEVGTVPGWYYRLSYFVGDAANGCNASLAVDAYAARAILKVPYESHGTGGHRRAELEFAAVANRTRVVLKVPYESHGTGGHRRAELEFAAVANRTRVVFHSSNHHMKSDATLCGPVIDDVSLVVVRKHAARRLRL